MVDVVVTDTAVTATEHNLILTAGVAITAGDVLYKDTADSNKAKLADADAEASAVVAGIALANAAVGQPVPIKDKGEVTIGSGNVVKGTFYYASTTAGGIAPHADLASGDYVSQLGYAKDTNTLVLDIKNTGITI